VLRKPVSSREPVPFRLRLPVSRTPLEIIEGFAPGRRRTASETVLASCISGSEPSLGASNPSSLCSISAGSKPTTLYEACTCVSCTARKSRQKRAEDHNNSPGTVIRGFLRPKLFEFLSEYWETLKVNGLSIMSPLRRFNGPSTAAPSMFVDYSTISSWITWALKMTYICGDDRLLRLITLTVTELSLRKRKAK
jgi:hypothetical protein